MSKPKSKEQSEQERRALKRAELTKKLQPLREKDEKEFREALKAVRKEMFPEDEEN